METTNLYNYSFENALRGKTPREIPELSEGYRNIDNSYIFPKGFKGDFNSALKKENLFRMYLFLANYRNKIFSLIILSKCSIKFLVRILLIFFIVYCKKVAQNINEREDYDNKLYHS